MNLIVVGVAMGLIGWIVAIITCELLSSNFLDALEDNFDMAMTFLRSMAEGYLENYRPDQIE